MRVALCFSGQPRFVEEAYSSIMMNIIECNPNHQIDIFAHLWFSEDICNKPLYANEFSSFSGGATIPENAVGKFVDLYRPIGIQVDEPEFFEASDYVKSTYQLWNINTRTDMCGISKEEWIKQKVSNELSKYCSLQKSMSLKSVNENKLGRYDLVFRLRTDCKLFRPLIFDQIDPVYLHSEEMNKPGHEISDWINFSNSTVMGKFGSIFNNFDFLVNHSHTNYGGWSAESLIKSMCMVNGFPERTVNTGCILPGWGKYAY